MSSQGKTKKSIWIFAAVSTTIIVTGCGAPDYAAMKPTVTKPSAAILLINHPSGWTSASVQQMRQSDESLTGLTTETVNVSLQKLSSTVNSLTKESSPTLIVEAFPGSVPESAVNNAKKHTNARFEFVGTSSPSVSGVNGRSLISQPEIAAYMTGWIAGYTCQEKGQQAVGWIQNTGGRPNVQIAQALLAGLYTADSALTLTPLTSGTAGSGTDNSVTNGTGGVQSTYVPKINVETDALSATNAELLSSHQAEVFSTVNASGSVASQPLPPPPKAMQSDLKAVMKGSWSTGVGIAQVGGEIRIDTARVSQTGATALQNLEQTAPSVTDIRKAWKNVPNSVRQHWQTQLGFSLS